MIRGRGWLVVAVLLAALFAWSRLNAPVSTGVHAPLPHAEAGDGRMHAPLAMPPDAASRTSPRNPRSARRTVDDVANGSLDLPPEARETLRLIGAGGPFAHRQDGSVFQNRERRLPSRPRGWYHEYTVDTRGARDRGARRIVTGGAPAQEYFYSDDHYRSFRRLPAQVGPP